MKQRRIFELDALRGLSLFGILLMNILVFSMPYEEAFLPDLVSGFDESLLRGITLFVISSFYPIFTFLFGYGLAIMYTNRLKKSMNYYPFIYRRFIFLLVLGMLHGFLLFSGDILFSYAFTGVIAVLFIKKTAEQLLKAAIILFAVKIIILVLPAFLMTLNDNPYSTFSISGLSVSEIIALKQSGTYSNFLSINVKEYLNSIVDTVTFSAYFEFLPYILFGMAAQKFNLVEKVKHNHSRTIISLITLLLIGYMIKIPYVIDYGHQGFNMISSMIGGPLVGFGYILLCLYLCQLKQFSHVLTIFKYPGKLSLTVYLMQSFIFTFIYVGLSLYNQLPLYQSYIIVLVVYGIQLVFCYFYLKYYRYGPIEWLWRKVTYLK